MELILVAKNDRAKRRKEGIDAILKAEDNLREGMNEEQIDLLEKYVDCIVGLHTVSEAEAFIKGIHFASSFFVEAFEMR